MENRVKSDWTTNRYVCPTADKLDKYQKIIDTHVTKPLPWPCHTHPAGLVYNGFSEFIVQSALSPASSLSVSLSLSSFVALSISSINMNTVWLLPRLVEMLLVYSFKLLLMVHTFWEVHILAFCQHERIDTSCLCDNYGARVSQLSPARKITSCHFYICVCARIKQTRCSLLICEL